MPVVRISILDDDGNPISGSKNYKLDLDLEKVTLDEIEEQVEIFRKNSLPEIEKKLLESSQQKIISRVKKTVQ